MDARWQLASMTAPDGDLGRIMPTAPLVVPALIELDGDRLVWSPSSSTEGPISRQPDKAMITRFIALARRKPAQVLRFARDYGVLGICHHGLPCSHNQPRPVRVVPGEPVIWCQPLGYPDQFWEPLEAWYHFAEEARGMLNRAARFHRQVRREPGDVLWVFDAFDDVIASSMSPEDTRDLREQERQGRERRRAGTTHLDDLTVRVAELEAKVAGGDDSEGTAFELDHIRFLRDCEAEDPGIDYGAVDDDEIDRFVLTEFVNEWLALGDVRPAFHWDQNGAAGMTFGGGLFGTLAVQLMGIVGRSEGLALCSACGSPYLPNRQPRAGENNYCPECKTKAKNREGQKRYRQRKKQDEALGNG